MDLPCNCQRVTVPIYGTMESAYQYLIDPLCLNNHDMSRRWRRLRDGILLTPDEQHRVDITFRNGLRP